MKCAVCGKRVVLDVKIEGTLRFAPNRNGLGPIRAFKGETVSVWQRCIADASHSQPKEMDRRYLDNWLDGLNEDYPELTIDDPDFGEHSEGWELGEATPPTDE
ncbi:hypothetical protein M0R72_16725 [Candidatus Pacearchaeota archaeon]|jgi:hypothetical protein|nr:hypothetical protein [Candidatus Pacearchaeota archaeon]